MVDWKKDVKISDLVRRRKQETPPGDAPESTTAKPKKERKPRGRSLSLSRSRKPKAAKEPKAAKGPKSPKPARAKSDRRGGRQKRLVGLKIGASQLAAARILNNGSPELVQVAQQALEPGIIVGGELREPDALAEALKRFFRDHKVPRQGVRLGIASNRIGVRTFGISDVGDQRQLDNAIRFRAQETLPIPLDEAVLDYQTLSESVDEEGHRVRRVLLVVAYRDLVDSYVTACRKAGIKLAGVDLEAFALLRALGEHGEEAATAAAVVVNVGHDRSTLAVANGPVCEFTRVIEWGGANLNVCIARALDLAPSEAEPVKRSLSLLEPAEEIEGLSPERAAAVRTAVHQELQTFARELVSSLQFYQGQPASLGIGEIILTGGTTHLAGLDVELAKLIGVRVRIGDPLARVKLGKKVGDGFQIGSLAVAIGLGIDD